MFYRTFGPIYILKSSVLLHFCRSGPTVFGKSANNKSLYVLACVTRELKYIITHISTLIFVGLSWWYCSWIHNYLCNQCLLPLKRVWIPLMARCTQYIMWWSLSVTCDRLVVCCSGWWFYNILTGTLQMLEKVVCWKISVK
jgi:hypothetical protein